MDKTSESCYDTAADDATRALIEGWDRAQTAKKKEEREKILKVRGPSSAPDLTVT